MRDSNSTSTATLAHRLQRQGTPGEAAASSLLVAVLLGAIGGALIGYAVTHPDSNDLNALYGIGGVLSFIALVLVYSGIHQMLAMKTPEATLEMNEAVMTRGTEVHFLIKQPGPVSLQSLRANLVGEETWTEARGTNFIGRAKNSSMTITRSRDLGTFNMLDAGAEEVAEHDTFERYFTFLVPADLAPSGQTAEGHDVAWKIEVWGKVRGRADFYHPFGISIVATH